MPRFCEADAPPQALRRAYLDGLAEPQELYLERLVAAGKSWRCDEIAYAVASRGQLVEFFVRAEHAADTVALFDAAMEASRASGVLCKSFDRQLLHAALSRLAEAAPIGLLFRRIVDASFAPREALTFRKGDGGDAMAIASRDDGFFDGPDEIQAYAAAGGLFVLSAHGETVGCGVAAPVVAGRADIDIGMWVAPEHRGNGYGTHIAAYLKHRYLSRGQRPICGCGAENAASYRALKAAGFESEHRILEIVGVAQASARRRERRPAFTAPISASGAAISRS
ncbi:MAG: GNAT family N-acetyltransferase [Methylocella sp.]